MGLGWCIFDSYAGRFIVSPEVISDIFAAIAIAKTEHLGVTVLSSGAVYEIPDGIPRIRPFGQEGNPSITGEIVDECYVI